MNNEEQAAVRSIAPADDHRGVNVVFDEESRGQLLHHYAGLAMQAKMSVPNRFGNGTVITDSDADQCVAQANVMIGALERYYTLRVNKARGNG